MDALTPGIYPDIPADEYHANEAVSRTNLELLRSSPLLYWDRVHNTNGGEKAATDALRFGSLFHSAALEPDTLESLYVVSPIFNRRTKAGKAEAEAFDQECAEKGLTVVSQDELDQAKAMAQAVRKHPIAGRMLTGGAAEQSVFWTDAETGLSCRCRPDYLPPLGADLAIVDIKSTISAGPGSFARSVANFGYHRQEAFYAMGVEAITGDALPMAFIAVEKARPFQVAVYTLPEDFVEKGRAQVRAALRLLAECKEKNEWPGYPAVITELPIPGWAYMED